MIFNMNSGGGGKKVPTLNSSYPQDLTVVAGNTATFMVLFDEEGKPADYTYTWYVNGSVVSGATSQNYVRDTTNDTGTYTVSCVVTNAAGSVTSRTASVTVQHRLTVNSNASAAITATSNGKTVSGTCNSSGSVTLTLTDGTWTVKATSSSVSATSTVIVNAHKSISLIANKIPAFTYTGTYKIVDDSDSALSASTGNWKIRFLTSGTLKFTALNGAKNGIDVFCVGGGGAGANTGMGSGGGGGGGGYTKTTNGVSVSTSTSYTITIGAGGASDSAAGGTTSAFNVSASGGSGANYSLGGNGGSGGGNYCAAGGSNGGSGGVYGSSTATSGQGATTREFGESSGTLYAGGGGGGGSFSEDSAVYGGAGGDGGGGDGGGHIPTGATTYVNAATAGSANTGGGGGGFAKGIYYTGYAAGGSGIVIIRNKR